MSQRFRIVMYWEDLGYLLSKNRYNENSVIIEIFTKNHGKTSGVIYGATSKKLKNYLQVGNKLHLNFNFKNDSKLGYFKIEICDVTTPIFFNNKKKLACIIYAMNLVKLLTVESQENINIFNLLDIFFILLKNSQWLKEFVLWELQFLKLIGYDLELKELVNNEIVNDKKQFFVKANNEKKIIPNFLVEIDANPIDNNSLINGFKLVGDYLNKSILKPSNISFPISRIEFLNMIK